MSFRNTYSVEIHPSVGISTNTNFIKKKASEILENLEAEKYMVKEALIESFFISNYF